MIRKRKRKANPLKPSTRSRVSKGPARDEKHLANVRLEKCLLHRDLWSPCYGALQAHHCRAIGPRTMGKRVSDYLVTPLCARHHILLHERGNEKAFWDGYLIDPAAWISSFSAEGRAAIQELKINKQE